MFKNSTLLLSLAALAQQTNAALGFTDWWKMAWCDFGSMYNFKDFACGVDPAQFNIISAGQRTDNTAGYSLDARVWTQESVDFTSEAIYVNLLLMSPVLTTGNVVELSFSVMDPKTGQQAMSDDVAATTQQYDTFVVAVLFGSDSTMDNYEWEVLDMYGPAASLPYGVNGAFGTAYNSNLDTAQSGTQNWLVDKGLSVNRCDTSMCEWSVTVFRPMDTSETADIAYTVGSEYFYNGAYKVRP